VFLHPLDPSVKCQFCKRGDLVFVRTRNKRDLYRCSAKTPCAAYTVHVRYGEDCGVATEVGWGVITGWVRCPRDAPPRG
jgi:hypothetical protein